MPVFKIATPDGRTLSIEAGDEQTALRGAQEWYVGQGKQPKADVSTMGDMAKSAGVGLAQGVIGLAGLPGDLSELGARGIDRAVQGIGSLTGMDVGAPRPDQPTRFGSQDIQGAVEGVTGKFYEPQTTAGEYARTVGEFAPAALGGGGLMTRAARAVVPAVASEAAGQATEGEDIEPFARAGAAIAAPFAMGGLRRAVSPFPASNERMAAVRTLEAEGVPVTAGQQSGSKGLRYAESELGGNQAANMMEEQSRAFTSAAMRRAGADGLADTDNMRALNDRLGQGFRDISARNQLAADQQLGNDIFTTVREYGHVLPAEQKQIFGNIVGDIIDRFRSGGGRISGEDYQMMRSRLSKRAQNARGSDNELADAYRGVRDALDNGMDRSIRPADAGEWARLRREYGNMKVLERAAVGGGEEAGMGIISPARLRMAASSGKSKGRYVRGEDDFSDLAHAGQAVMTPLPNSGTPGRLRAQNLGAFAPMMIGSATGGAYGTQEGGLMGGLAGAAMGAVLPRGVGYAMMSRPGQAYMRNQIAANARDGVSQEALINAIIAFQQSRPLYQIPAAPAP
jgi:hypothetical protein